jgi:hypothetical protein
MGTIKFGSLEIASGSLKVGSSNVQKVYKGTNQIYPFLDIVRSGLLYAFDWTSFNGDGTLTDRSSNAFNATYSGSLTVSASSLQFDGVTSYIQMADSAKSGAYHSWEWTVDTFGSLYTQPFTTSSYNGNIIAGNLGPKGGTPSGSWNYPFVTAQPYWQFGLYQSGSNSPQLTMYNDLTNQRNSVTASLNSSQFTYLGVSGSGGSGSTISTYYNTQQLPTTKSNLLVTRVFDIGNTNEFNLTSSIQTFGGPRVNYTSPFGEIDFLPLSGSIKYIAYYNRPLTQAELNQNNQFYLTGNAIPIP